MVPEVKTCTVQQCFYQRNEECHAHAITVGHTEPNCDTFAQTQSKIDKAGAGEVGACHVIQCSYNDKMFCHACDDIVVNMVGDKAICSTFRQR